MRCLKKKLSTIEDFASFFVTCTLRADNFGGKEKEKKFYR